MEKSNIIKLLGLSILSALMLWASWPPNPLFPLVFIAFVPLLFVENIINQIQSIKSTFWLFNFCILTFSIWNGLTTYWIYHASLEGAISAVLLNSLFMSLVFVLYHLSKKWTSKQYGLLYLGLFWIAFEFIHYHWDFSWPWLNLGNVFANAPNWVQWYEYTGVLGGSLWIWLINIFIFKLTQGLLKFHFEFHRHKSFKTNLILLVIIFSLPLLISKLIKIDVGEKSDKNIVIVQPNIDPYTEKFNSSLEDQIEKLVNLSRRGADSNTTLFLWPETAISKIMDEGDIENNRSYSLIMKFLKEYPNTQLVTGADTYKYYPKGERSNTARFNESNQMYYDIYNAALSIAPNGEYLIYHKIKLVPGVERMPFPKVFKFLEKFIVKLGGTSGSRGVSVEPVVFPISDNIIVAPIICFESTFGDHCGDFVMKGANVLTIMTNDGWWSNTGGYKQHFAYARLRAIELRKTVLRSANTGISGIINSKGEVLQQTDWAQPDFIKGEIITNNQITFYAKNGDYVGRISLLISLIVILVSSAKRIMKNNVFEKKKI